MFFHLSIYLVGVTDILSLYWNLSIKLIVPESILSRLMSVTLFNPYLKSHSTQNTPLILADHCKEVS